MFSVNITQAHIYRGIRSNKMVSFHAKKTDQRIKKDKIIQSDLFGYSYKEQELLDNAREMILNAMLSFYSFDYFFLWAGFFPGSRLQAFEGATPCPLHPPVPLHN